MWYEKFGFKKNPLDVRSNTNLVGVDDIEQTLVEYIKQGQICHLYGFTGSGKSSMLERIQNRDDLKKYRFISLSGDRMKPEHEIEEDLKRQLNFFEKIIRKRPSNYIILLDESHEVSRYVTETVKGYWNAKSDEEYGVHSVIICQIEENLKTNFSGSFGDRIGSKKLQMKKLTADELKEVLINRLEASEVNLVSAFNPDALELLITSSGGSVRSLLDMVSHVFMFLDRFEENPLANNELITKEIVFNILGTMGVKLVDEEVKPYEDILSSDRMQEAITKIKTMGAFDTVALSKALKTKRTNARNIIHQLRKNSAIIFSHKDKKRKFWVLAPRLRHESVQS